jgi:glycosyltransferase involved in cell wall biosynthesis
MKKKLAFVIPSLDAGGGEKSLVNLLNAIDAERYDIDLLLFHKRGIFLNSLPAHVTVLEPKERFKLFGLGLAQSIIAAATRLDFTLMKHRLLFAIKNKRIKNVAHAEQHSWQHSSAMMEPLEGEYDVAIGFLEKSSVYFAIDKITAKKKIGFIHTNYLQMGMDVEFDRPYFAKLDAIVTVSGECGNVLAQVFPEFADKITIVHNITSPELIRRLATTGNANEIKGGAVIVSVGRLHPLKGFDLAVAACAILVGKGIPVQWFVIGDGEQRNVVEKAIADNKLENHFFLLGLRENPYPYVNRADVYVQPSRLEGKSIAIDEAKILGKPIVVTNYTTVADQITHEYNGIVCDMNPQGIADGIIRLLDDVELRQKLSGNLAHENLGTISELEKFYEIIEKP